MASRLLAAALLAVSLAGTASAAQVKGPDVSSDAAAHGTVADLASPWPAKKADAGAWSMAGSWTIESTPVRWTKAFRSSSVMGDAEAAAAQASKSPPALVEEMGASPRPALDSRGTDNLNAAFPAGADVAEHRPDGKAGKVG